MAAETTRERWIGLNRTERERRVGTDTFFAGKLDLLFVISRASTKVSLTPYNNVTWIDMNDPRNEYPSHPMFLQGIVVQLLSQLQKNTISQPLIPETWTSRAALRQSLTTTRMCSIPSMARGTEQRRASFMLRCTARQIERGTEGERAKVIECASEGPLLLLLWGLIQ